MEGKCWVKTWTALLAVIFHPGSPHINLEKQDLRENEEGRNREREREREREKGHLDSSNSPGHDLSSKQVHIFQEVIRHMGKTTLLYQILHSVVV